MDPLFKIPVQESLGRQEVMRTLGIEITRLEPGEITLTMPYAAAYTQQHGFVHAGIVATALDNACGGAAFSLMPEDADSSSIFSPRPGAIHSFLGARS